MIELQDHEFKDVIKKLELLQSVEPDRNFKKRMGQKVRHHPAASMLTMPFFALRVAFVVFFVLASGTSMIAAARETKPGDMLYPVKQAMESVKPPIAPAGLSNTPTQLPKKSFDQMPLSPTVLPTLSPDQNEQQQTPRDRTNEGENIPTPTPLPPTPTPAQQSVLPAVAKQAIRNAGDKFPAHVQLPVGGPSHPTPTPKPKHEGSKDNGSNVGAGGSLLPKFKD